MVLTRALIAVERERERESSYWLAGGREKGAVLAELILPIENGYGFFVSSAVGEQFMPAKGFSGFTRGEQRCASGAAFSPPACEPVGGWG